jgi:hypothetical protein
MLGQLLDEGVAGWQQHISVPLYYSDISTEQNQVVQDTNVS